MFSWKNCKMLRRGKGTASMMASSRRLHTKEKKNAVPTANSSACENIRFSSLFAALDVSPGGTSATEQGAAEIPYWWRKSMFTL